MNAVSPDGFYTVEEMRASFPYCPVCECETIPLRDGACAWCDTLIAPKREEAEQREHEAERHRVYKLSHKDQINKRRRELRRERQGHVRRYRIANDALLGDSSLNTAQVMPSGEVTEERVRDVSVPVVCSGETTDGVFALGSLPSSVTSSLTTRPEPPYPTQNVSGAVRAGLAETTHGEIAELAPAPNLIEAA